MSDSTAREQPLMATAGKPSPPMVKSEKTQPEQEVFAIMEKRDEQQIIKQLQGEIVDEYFYSFKVGNREVTGLSWTGIKEVARHMGNIKLEVLSILDKEDQYQVVIKATDTLRNLDQIGVSAQPKIDKWTHKPDDFVLQKAMSKATRNAIRNLLPEKLIATMLKKFREGNKR